MSESRFKPGDRVVRTGSTSSSFPDMVYNTVYTVREASDRGISVEEVRYASGANGPLWSQSMFELAYEPEAASVTPVVGRVYSVTLDGVKNVTAVMDVDGDWYDINTGLCFAAGDATDVKPLIVLDLVNVEKTITVLLRLVDSSGVISAGVLSEIVTQIEAQTLPVKTPVDEPGTWGVVEASLSRGGDRVELVRHPGGHWFTAFGTIFSWDVLFDPVVVRDGVEKSES